jgi:hypothetical protein
MDLFELIMALSVAVIMPIVIVKMVLDFRRERLRAEREAREPQGSLTAGELKRLLREVVDEANEPLIRRLDMLEQIALPPYEQESEVSDEVPAERTMGRSRTP